MSDDYQFRVGVLLSLLSITVMLWLIYDAVLAPHYINIFVPAKSEPEKSSDVVE